MFCSQCAHKLTPTDVYCPKCAKPIASFNFDPGQIPQVEYIGDNETETVVRPTPTKPTARIGSKAPVIFNWIAGTLMLALLAAGAIFAIAFISVSIYRTATNDGATLNPPPPVNTDRASAATPAPAETPIPTETPKPATPKPTRTPIDVDAMREIEEKRQRDRDNAAAINAARNANMPRNANVGRVTIPTIDGFPAVDQNGRRLRAWCKNGRPSYWSGDRFFVCGANGGIYKLYW